MAAARIVLLVLSVGLFAAAWSGDQSRSRHETSAAAARLQTAMTRMVSLSRVAAPIVEEPRGCNPAASTSALLETWQLALPLRVTPGEYLLVETTGQTQRVVLTAELLQSLGHDPDVRGEAIYTLRSSARSAYLIRITAPRDGSNIAEQSRTAIR